MTNEKDLLGKFCSAVLKGGEFGAMYTFMGMAAGAPTMAQPLLETMTKAAQDFPDTPQFVSVTCPPEITAAYERAGFLVYEDPARAMKVIGALARFRHCFATPVSASATTPVDPAPKIAADVTFNEVSAKEVLARVGISHPSERLVMTAEAAAKAAQEIGFPVGIKIVSPDIVHKTDVGGVALGLADEAAAIAAVEAMQQQVLANVPGATIDGYLVTAMVQGGVECILGTSRDPVFGPILMFGLGGVLVELMQDVTFRRVPVSEDDARAMIREVRGFPLLDGYRGKPAADIDALIRAICGLSRFVDSNRDVIESVEINPLLVMPKGQGAMALDAVIETVRRNELEKKQS